MRGVTQLEKENEILQAFFHMAASRHFFRGK